MKPRAQTGPVAGDVTVVVLAGGAGSRMAPLTRGFPKTLLPLFEEPLLLRLLRQVFDCGLRHVLVYGAPNTVRSISSAIGQVQIPAESVVEVVTSRRHVLGPAAALVGMHRRIRTAKCLLLLGDIVYAAKPFMELHQNATHLPALGCSRPPSGVQLTRGIVVRTRSGLRLLERPRRPRKHGLAWSGAAFFDVTLLDSFGSRFGEPPATVPIGDVFDLQRRTYPLHTFAVPPFVNVNTLTDFAAAHLLTMSEQMPLSEQARIAATRLAQSLSALGV